MCSPVGHMLSGIILAYLSADDRNPTKGRLAVGTFAAAAPDLDLLPCLIGYNWEDVHRLATHSVTMVLFVGVCLALAARFGGWRIPWQLITACLAAHVLLDMLNEDVLPPEGVMLFWPFSKAFFIMPIHIFGDLRGALHSTSPMVALAVAALSEAWRILALGVATWCGLMVIPPKKKGLVIPPQRR